MDRRGGDAGRHRLSHSVDSCTKDHHEEDGDRHRLYTGPPRRDEMDSMIHGSPASRFELDHLEFLRWSRQYQLHHEMR
ncbi:MAG TPA: hypothetical protein VHS97_21025, partial [Isosphaeraceae bacterium]|nr:hypothetical protein [Isosphaeraceae bacterium]